MSRHCTVSIKGEDDQLHSVETDAESLFEAAYAGVQQWAKLWWYAADSVIEVRSGDQLWRVRAGRVSAWGAERFRERAKKGGA